MKIRNKKIEIQDPNSITKLMLNVLSPVSFSLDPDEKDGILSTPLIRDLATPYEADDKAENGFRLSLVAACHEVKGLDSCLTLGERQKMKEVRSRRKLVGLQNS
mgnify:CR=1 FL=1